jgi:outer membrane protein TolC
LEIEAINKAKLPKIDLNAQATYQSDVTSLPISYKYYSKSNKDQYRTTVDVNQLIYNGGLIDATAKIKKRKPNAATTNRSQPIPDPESICTSRPFCYKSDMLF